MFQDILLRLVSAPFDSLVKRDSTCTGGSQECEKPASSSYKKAIILGVLVPVAVIVLLFSCIFMHLKHKSRKELIEMENDPQFDGNLEFYEYDTPQIANTFNQVNNSSLLGRDNDIDYEKEGEYENKHQSNNQNRNVTNPFE